jgi:hypothetical protein
MYVATSSSDKYIRLYDFYSGECLSKVGGHSEVVTGLAFTLDSKALISVSGDGCIFIWKLSPELTKNIHARLNELQQQQQAAATQPTNSTSTPDTNKPTGVAESRVDLENIQLEFEEGNNIPNNEFEEGMKINNNSELEDEFDQLRMSDAHLPSWARSANIGNHGNEPHQVQLKGRWKQVPIKHVMECC